MRDLIIDMADFGGVVSAGDEVVLSAPAVRGSSVDPGRLITPQPRALELVDGVVTVPVEVGPLQVTLKPRGGVLSGTTFKTVVPEGEGPITLRACLESQFRYDPPVVNRGLDLIGDARDEALGQVSGAVDAEISEHLDSKVDQTDPRLPHIQQGEYAAVIGDGEHVALAVTLDGSIDFRRATPDTKAALMGTSDAVQASQDGYDHYAFQVSDRDGNIALAIDRSGAVDFRRVTPELEEHLRAIISQGPGIPTDPTPIPEPGGGSRDVWVPDVDDTGLHATHLDTGKRLLLSTTTAESRQVGDSILWDEAGVQMYQKHPDEPAWRATDRTRIVWWGSSSISESHGELRDMANSFGITDQMWGGFGGDWSHHILGRMGAVPFTLAHDITIPATGEVQFDTTNGPTVTNATHVWSPGILGGVQGKISHRRWQYTFQRDADGDAVQVVAGEQFIPDAISYRDAPAILQIGKNDLGSPSVPAEVVLEQTEIAYQWLRTLPEWVVVLGHHVNSNSDSAMISKVKKANDLCRERYQERFIDLQAYLSSSEVWDHTGFTPTQEDLDRQAAGVMPLVFARDSGAHMNETVQLAYVQNLVTPHLEKIGWF